MYLEYSLTFLKTTKAKVYNVFLSFDGRIFVWYLTLNFDSYCARKYMKGAVEKYQNKHQKYQAIYIYIYICLCVKGADALTRGEFI